MATSSKKNLLETVEIGLGESSRKAVVDILNTVLSDLETLYTKTRNYHWNVRGPHFHSLHEMFEEQYSQMAEDIDETAERVRSLGGFPLGTMAEFRDRSRISEHPGEYPDAAAMVKNLLKDHEAIAKNLREDIELVEEKHTDVGTADFLTALLEKHEKTAWMLRATAS